MASVSFYWNDTRLRAAPRVAYTTSVAEAAAIARARAPWAHVRAGIAPTPGGIASASPDTMLAEKGARPHTIEPSRKLAAFGNGTVATGPIAHPGFSGTPFMQPAAEAWPSLCIAALRAAL